MPSGVLRLVRGSPCVSHCSSPPPTQLLQRACRVTLLSSMTIWLKVTPGALLLTLAVLPRTASAFCAPDTWSGEVVWSLPAQGDVGVATNADYWPAVLGTTMPTPTLGEVELVANGLGGFDLGELEPDTHYTIHHPDFDGVPHDIEFTTGAGPGAGDVATTMLETVREVRPIDDENNELCRSILHSQDCFDTGNPRYYQLLTGQSPRAWLVQIEYRPQRAPIVLPQECIPSVWSYSDLGCVRIGVVTERGTSELTEWYCDGPTEGPAEHDADAPDADAPDADIPDAGPAPVASSHSESPRATTKSETATSGGDGCAFAPPQRMQSSSVRSSTGWRDALFALALFSLRRNRLRAA